MRRHINLADERLGAKVLFATDEFFGAKERMLSPGEPEWRAGVYDANGKWMDGWETRRRRNQGHDHCVLQLAAPGRLVLLDMPDFKGGHYRFFAIHRTDMPPGPAASFLINQFERQSHGMNGGTLQAFASTDAARPIVVKPEHLPDAVRQGD